MLKLSKINGDILFANAEEAADTDHHGMDFAIGRDHQIIDGPDLLGIFSAAGENRRAHHFRDQGIAFTGGVTGGHVPRLARLDLAHGFNGSIAGHGRGSIIGRGHFIGGRFGGGRGFSGGRILCDRGGAKHQGEGRTGKKGADHSKLQWFIVT